MRKPHKIETNCVHAGVRPEPITGAVMTPIFQTSTYVQPSPGKPKVFDYSRAGNPTRAALEEALAVLEEAKYSLTFASGLAATQAVCQTLNPGDHVLVSDDVYGGTGRMFRKIFSKYGIDFEFVDLGNLTSVKSSIRKTTKMIWSETPTNPLLRLCDIEALSAIAKKAKATLVVDNTFASPIFQKPLSLGADLVIHSSTKYLGGHSDLVGGAIMTSRTDLYEPLKFLQFAGGSVNSPFECFLILRSLKTLAIRMKKHHENAIRVAEALGEMKDFKQVIFPGLASHPQHKLARKQMSGFSGMLSARLSGDFNRVKRFLSRLEIVALAESLGGVESLVNHPELMTHASVPPEHRKKIGITSDLLRFSIGIEDADDLIADIRQALK